MFKKFSKTLYFIIIILVFVGIPKVYASIVSGTIDSSNHTAQVCETAACAISATSPVNFGYFTTTPASNVEVTDTELKGFIWGSSFGWVELNCANAPSGCSSTNGNFKVANDHNGHLSGYAWGQDSGWINFGPFTNNSTSPVVINSAGQFNGYAWSQNYGWIKFDCSNANYCVKTDWRPQNTRPQCSDGIDNDNNGLIDSADPSCHTDRNSSNASSYDPTINLEFTSSGGHPIIGGGSTDLCPNIAGDQATMPAGKVLNSAGDCVDAPTICPNTVVYTPVPISSPGDSFKVTFNNTSNSVSKLGFAIKTYDKLNPAHSAGDLATENILNKDSRDQVVVFTPSINKYVLGFEDIVYGDYDYNDLVVALNISCNPSSGSTCPTPDSLSDTTIDTINNSPAGEKNLQSIFTTWGYSFNNNTDQKQYQVWNIPANTSVTINAKELARYAGNGSVFGYYTGSSMSTFVPIFKTVNVAAQSSTTIPALCNPNPNDFCPNIAGNQTTMPPGMVLNTAGDCVYIIPDVCPNIPGSQALVPSDMMYNPAGDCVPLNIPIIPNQPTDMCPNLVGVQSQIPSTMVKDSSGMCVTKNSNTDLCSNISGSQTTVPSGYELSGNGICTPIVVSSTCMTDPSLCLPPPNICTTHPELCTTPPPVQPCTTNPSLCLPPPNICTTHPELCTPKPTTPTTPPPSSSNQSSTPNTQILSCKNMDCLILHISLSFNDVKKIYSGLQNMIVVKATPLIGIFTALVFDLANSLFSTPISSSELSFVPMRLWNLLLAFLGIRRKRPWGVVYDSITKQPLDPCYLTLEDMNGKEISSCITDIDGRYGFLAPAGRYKIVAHKADYTFPSEKLSGKTSDELYQDLYFGDFIDIKDDEVVDRNIPMDSVKFNWNEYAKDQEHLMNFFSKRNLWVARISNIVFTIGFIFSLFALVVTPDIYNSIVFVVYVFFTIFKITILRSKALGLVKDSHTSSPLPFAIMRIFYSGTSMEVSHKVTNMFGKYFCLVPNGNYQVKIEKKNPNGDYSLVYTSEPIEVKSGNIHDVFEV